MADDQKYYNRKEKESSTSTYIQANINNKDGGFEGNSKVLKETPSEKIIKPQLKEDEQETYALIIKKSVEGGAADLVQKSQKTKIKEPKPTDDKAKYGQIQVKENKAGFVVINDETEGNVRQIDLHPTGTYTALLDNGDYHTKITKDRQEIIDKEWRILTYKDKIEILVGSYKVEIRKDVFTNITGNSDYNLEGTFKELIEGDVTKDYRSNYSAKIAEDYVESVGGDKNEDTGGDWIIEVTGDEKQTIQGALTIQVVGNINLTSSATTNIIASKEINIKAPKINIG